jgi:pyruvate kinase
MTAEAPLQIVATIGPASQDLLAALRDAGATAFRLNASHLPIEELVRLAAAVRDLLPDCPLIVDLQGAKMRLGRFVGRAVRAGDRLRFSLSGTGESAQFCSVDLQSASRLLSTCKEDP